MLRTISSCSGPSSMPNSSAIFRPGKLACLVRRKNEPASRCRTMKPSGVCTIHDCSASSRMVRWKRSPRSSGSNRSIAGSSRSATVVMRRWSCDGQEQGVLARVAHEYAARDLDGLGAGVGRAPGNAVALGRVGQHDRRVAQRRRARWRRRRPVAGPGIGPDVVVVAAGGEEERLVAEAGRLVGAERIAGEGGGGAEGGGGQGGGGPPRPGGGASGGGPPPGQEGFDGPRRHPP